ncbi:hypothetical protein JTB14_024380 [Gonioctena quinquepunctata]|nr:hypothetical protein JTB14_024380 [Gonioctena quinquepunctata]
MFVWIILVLCTSLEAVFPRTLCSSRNAKITCSSMQPEDLYGEMSVVLNPEDVLDLNVSRTFMRQINRTTFGRYRNIHTLNLQNNYINHVEKNAFADLVFLRNLNLRNNLLKSFDSDIFGTFNSLYLLDLSNNVLDDLSGFNISDFPSLMIMNVSNNLLEYLPNTFIEKLEESDSFYLIIDDNPWNCSHPGWNLNPTLITPFCTERVFDLAVAQEKLKLLGNMDSLVEEFKSLNTNRNNEAPSGKCPRNWCFSYCVFWFIAAIWIGIIVGNIGKLKDIVCRTTLKVGDKKTQYDKVDKQTKV